MKIIVINGKPRAGKDLFVTKCQQHLLWCKNISTVDFVKTIASRCGWDGTKSPKNRAFLSDLKDLLSNWDDVPFKKTRQAAELYESEAATYDFPTEDVLVFIHCREPHEIQRFVDEMNAQTLLMRRATVEDAEQSNHADSEVFQYNYDYIINNDGTEEELEQKAIEFLKTIGFEKQLTNL